MPYGMPGGDTPESEKFMMKCVSDVSHQKGKDGKIMGKQRAVAICKASYAKSKSSGSSIEPEYIHLDLASVDFASMGMPMNTPYEETPMAMTGYNPVDLLYIDIAEVTYLQTCMRKKIGEGEDPDTALTDCYTEYCGTMMQSDTMGNSSTAETGNNMNMDNMGDPKEMQFMKECMRKMMEKGQSSDQAKTTCHNTYMKSNKNHKQAEFVINSIIAKYSR